MQSALTTTFPSGATWSQASGWPSKLAQDPRHRHTTEWRATAVWGCSGRLGYRNASAAGGTLAGESTRKLNIRLPA